MIAESNVRPLRRPAGATSFSARRLNAGWLAEIEGAGETDYCTVLDVSAGGAKLRLDGNLPEGAAELSMTIQARAGIAATIVWRKAGQIGVRFKLEQKWVSDTVRGRFDAAAWLQKDRN